MDQVQVATFNCIAAGILLLLRFILKGYQDLLSYSLLFYFLLAFGNIINFLIGNPIYFGIPIQYIGAASQNFLIAIASAVIISFVIPKGPRENLKKSPLRLHTLFPLLVIFSSVSILVIGYLALFVNSTSKVELIQKIGPSIHYNYLLIQLYLTSFYYFAKSQNEKRLYWLNFMAYMAYCILTGERDFIFPIISIALHIFTFNKLSIKRITASLVGITALAFLATWIFYQRDSTQQSASVISSILGQGSLLFVNAYTIKLMNESYNFFSGYTYINSFLNLLPSFIYSTDFNTLTWFKNNYAAQSTSGYGFGLAAEGYMNFGRLGVAMTFSLIALVQRLVIRNINRYDFLKYYSIFFHGFIMYSYRNDSLALFKGCLYAGVFYYILRVSSFYLPSKRSED